MIHNAGEYATGVEFVGQWLAPNSDQWLTITSTFATVEAAQVELRDQLQREADLYGGPDFPQTYRIKAILWQSMPPAAGALDISPADDSGFTRHTESRKAQAETIRRHGVMSRTEPTECFDIE